MNNRRVLLGIMCLTGLFAVRHFEVALFYDPLKAFFNGAYQTQALPAMNWLNWGLSIVGRYCINAILSLSLLKLIFRKNSIVQFSAILYGIGFVVFMSLLIVFVYYYNPGDYRALFYVRRFLIHPLLLLLLIPSFLVLNPKKKT